MSAALCTAPYATTVRCPHCARLVGVTAHGLLAVHARLVRGREALCPGTGDPAARTAACVLAPSLEARCATDERPASRCRGGSVSDSGGPS